MADTAYTVEDQFIGKAPNVRAVYDSLLVHLRSFGSLYEEPKKTSIHLANKSGFAGVHTRKNYLILNIRSDHQNTDDIDGELLSWLKAAYDLSN
jgi:Domain of unknown function (DUF5655)